MCDSILQWAARYVLNMSSGLGETKRLLMQHKISQCNGIYSIARPRLIWHGKWDECNREYEQVESPERVDGPSTPLFPSPQPCCSPTSCLVACLALPCTCQVTLPFLVLHGDKDVTTDPDTSKLLHEKARSTDKEIKIYPDLWHDLLEGEMDENIETVMKVRQAGLQWCGRRVRCIKFGVPSAIESGLWSRVWITFCSHCSGRRAQCTCTKGLTVLVMKPGVAVQVGDSRMLSCFLPILASLLFVHFLTMQDIVAWLDARATAKAT